jgi:WS/DGAT C-terminal domain
LAVIGLPPRPNVFRAGRRCSRGELRAFRDSRSASFAASRGRCHISTIVASSPRRGAAANVLISNIPGSRVPQYMAGARLVAHYPLSAIFHGLGLNITVVSYGDQVDWGIAGDPEQIGDAWGMIEDLVAAQAELFALVPARAPAGAAV